MGNKKGQGLRGRFVKIERSTFNVQRKEDEATKKTIFSDYFSGLD